jgi:preprotein translocase subunit YajC
MGSTTTVIAYFVIIAAMIYFLMYRPQQAQQKKVRELMAALTPGDEIVTVGGMMGTLRSMDDETVTVEIADGVLVRFARRAIADRLTPAAGPEDE